MKTRDLEYFQKVVECRSFTRAAAQCQVSQPTVTAAIKRLEKEFAVQLIQRDHVHQQITITRPGQILYRRTRQLGQELVSTRRELLATQTPKIRLGLPPIIGTTYFPRLVPELLRLGLLDQLQITESGSQKLLESLLTGKIDLALLGSALPLQNPRLQTKIIGQRPFVVVTSRQHSLAQQQEVRFSELAQEQFIGLTQQYVHPYVWRQFCQYAGIDPPLLYRAMDISWVKGLVQANLGISLLVVDAVSSADDLHCLKLQENYPEHFYISVAYRQNYVLAPQEEQLVQSLIAKDFEI
ncbi:LysR family transcriptional regulator [Lactobacillus sp. DCY120]|uniref:LysR family transcriptional regulator n=1 Tax=Bombilactobacillus apium TaxID=2675299 RepID=A0A850R6F7_9LACO|nr:LysR family transcriptional regulator [Bombilactobacillus apium]NVY96222.1 LysR family transcriptional regulator [Bombilactobacillus apium]